jgi:hypothetical protein
MTKVCLSVDTIGYPEGGGYFWCYLNWALGLRSLGCEVAWLEALGGRPLEPSVASLRSRLEPYGLANSLALWEWGDLEMPPGDFHRGLTAAADADLLINFRYDLPSELVRRFRRSALVDDDPGLLQLWLRAGELSLAEHDLYVTTGENIEVLDPGREWFPAVPCVALDWWRPAEHGDDAAFTTLSHWHGEEWFDDGTTLFRNDKRSGFLPYFDLPARTDQPLELALLLADEEAAERAALEARGWRIRNAHDVARTPWDYERYVQASLGEFSCAKPSTVFLGNAWISDRTVCYLASGKPAVVQHTGPSEILPSTEGIWRFRTPDEAARYLDAVAADYDRQCRAARELAEEHFDARAILSRLLERAIA